MKRTILPLALCCLLWYTAGNGQSGPSTGTPSGRADSAYPAPADPVPTASPQASPVSYASVTQLNNMLSQLEAVSKNTQTDLRKLRIDRWKTDGSNKKQVLGQVDSIQRNLQDALPGMIAALRTSPEDLPATFKLFRNLDALYDVLGGVTESAGAFGSKDDLQELSNDLSSLEAARKSFGERIENLAASKEAEIHQLRNDLKAAQAQIPAPPPKKIVVDDTQPPPKPTKKKTAKKPAITPVPGQTQTPPAQPPPQSKPQ